jgi:hypothetical protein
MKTHSQPRVFISSGTAKLEGKLILLYDKTGIVLFARSNGVVQQIVSSKIEQRLL